MIEIKDVVEKREKKATDLMSEDERSISMRNTLQGSSKGFQKVIFDHTKTLEDHAEIMKNLSD